MNTTGSLETIARHLFEREWEKEYRERELSSSAKEQRVCVLPQSTIWVLHDLIQMIAESHDRSVHRMAPMVRRLIAEQNFADDCGDPIISADREAQIDLQVDVVLRVLEEVRHIALDRGLWSNAPMAPQMFG